MIDEQPDIETKTIESTYGIWEEWWDCMWAMKYKGLPLPYDKLPYLSFSVVSGDKGDTWYVLAELKETFTMKGIVDGKDNVSSEVWMDYTWDSSDDAGIWYQTRDDAIKAVDDAIEGMIYPVRGERK